MATFEQWIAVDFDDTLCESQYPDIGPPKDGAREALTYFRELGYRILIHSCRTSSWKSAIFNDEDCEPLQRQRVKAMIEWLDANAFPYDAIDDGTKGKPHAAFYIDDKGIRFSGNWQDVVDTITQLTLEQRTKRLALRHWRFA